jgi:predicted ATPase/DNA-binding SARP family transcriptional activator/DNA-binding CsgD family transcriptional regulator
MTQPEAPLGKRPEAMRIWLLGGFRVSVGARTIGAEEWRLRKAAALVKILSLAPGHRLHREQAMALLWADSRRKAASASLRSALHVARSVLDPTVGGRYLASENESLVLSPGGDLWVDVVAFEGAAATARRAKEPATYRAALDVYGGDLLPEDRYEQWTEGRRGELRQLYLSLLVELAGLHEERHEHESAIYVLRKATAEEPTFEEAHAALMRLHALSARPEGALAQYERLSDALSRGLGTEPTPATRRLRNEIATGRLLTTPPVDTSRDKEVPGVSKHNLPAPMTSFVGREREMLEVKRLLPMTRLLTLAGAGGSGKTRLALEVASDLIGVYPDGVWMAELAPLSEPGLVAQEVAGALGVTERPGEQLADTLVDFLGKKEMLLVLDNCEHLVEVAARLAEYLLYSCPRLRVLATSREPLGIAGEVVWQVEPLSLPDRDEPASVESLMRYEALRMFVERARLRLPDFGLTEENAGAVARVCRKLDGIPLAIELATARMGALAVEQVAQRLEISLDVLKGAGRTAAARQRTLKATLDWSHDLLSEPERGLFRKLSVFAGGWTLDAAEAVCSTGGVEREKVLDLLGALVDKSLVVAGATTEGAVRYRMLEPVRQYAQELLEQGGQAEEVRVRHGAHFLSLAEEAEPGLTGSQQTVWADRLEREHDNLREALSWFLERGEDETALRLGAALWRFWHVRGYLTEGSKWLELVLAEGEPAASPAWVKALEGRGWIFQYQGDQERAKGTYEEMLKLSSELGDKGNVATALNSLGTVAAQQGDNGQARALLQENLEVIEELEAEGDPAAPLKKHYVFNLLGYLAINEEGDYARGATLWEESLTLAREVGDGHLIGTSLTSLGHVALLQRDFERVKALSQEALAFAHELGSAGVEIIPSNLINLGLASLNLGEHKRAAQSFEVALVASKDMGRTPQVLETLEGMAGLAGAVGEAARAARLWGAAGAARELTGIGAFTPDEWALHEPHLASARTELGEAAWEEALANGREMSLEVAADYALSREEADPPTLSVPQKPPAGEPADELTSREEEVAILVARGLTNRQVSTRLGISERTAGNHVAKILRKLKLSSRVQIATWASETQPPTSRSD